MYRWRLQVPAPASELSPAQPPLVHKIRRKKASHTRQGRKHESGGEGEVKIQVPAPGSEPSRRKFRLIDNVQEYTTDILQSKNSHKVWLQGNTTIKIQDVLSSKKKKWSKVRKH